jgi:hypothetical protein
LYLPHSCSVFDETSTVRKLSSSSINLSRINDISSSHSESTFDSSSSFIHSSLLLLPLNQESTQRDYSKNVYNNYSCIEIDRSRSVLSCFRRGTHRSKALDLLYSAEGIIRAIENINNFVKYTSQAESRNTRLFITSQHTPYTSFALYRYKSTRTSN